MCEIPDYYFVIYYKSINFYSAFDGKLIKFTEIFVKIMKQSEKTAIVRILTDLIKSDTVIDTREIDLFSEVCRRYNINMETALAEAQKITLAEAVKRLAGMTASEYASVYAQLEKIALADGKCEPQEALLILALQNVHPRKGGVIDTSCDVLDNIAPFTVIYVESEYDEETNDAIVKNYRAIECEFCLAGFEFVYIPQKSKEYAMTDKEKMLKIIGHLASTTVISGGVGAVYDGICNLSTVDFCRSLLYNKLGLGCIYDTEPSFLVKIGDSRVSFKPAHDYLKLMISGDDILEEVRAFVDTYRSIVKDGRIDVKNPGTSEGLFRYSGFNKSIFDLLAFPGKSYESRILVDTARHRIFFEDINAELDLSAYERALYVFLLYANATGKVVRRNESSAARRARLDEVFDKIYRMMGKWDGDEPKSYLSGNIATSLSRIKRRVNELELLDNKHLYIPTTEDDVISVKVASEKVQVLDVFTGKKLPIQELI